MFERFHRVSNVHGRSHEGSGIGLALVNEIVKLHGGTIQVQSRLGEGAAFTVSIPKGSAHLPVERVKALRNSDTQGASRAGAYVAEVLGWLRGPLTQDPAQAAASPARADRPRILLADDNADLREYVGRMLAEHYDVQTVADGREALAAVHARRPHLVISDVMMPSLDGFGLIAALRADPQWRAIPVILLSARAGEEARVEGIGRGADDYLAKPFSSHELLVRVGALLRSAEMHRRADEARAQFETLLNEAPLGVYVVDDDFRIAAVNPVAAPVFGETRDLVGRDFDEVMHVLWPKAYADEVVALFRRTLATGEPHFVPEHIEERLDSRVTEFYEWQINRIPLPGDRQGVVCYFRDIAKSVLAREALRDADARKDEFLATLAHELRNPLAPLSTSLEMLKGAHPNGPPPAAALEIMERQLSHLVRLVDDLMEVSRITRGDVELRREAVRLDVALRNALETSEALIRAGRHRISLALPSEPIVLSADAVRLAQIFTNLLDNAAKYSEHGGAISVEARREGHEAVVVVSDTGQGIEAAELPQLFKVFSRGARNTNQSGLGIGLALVRRLVELHGGRIDAMSEGRGRGSRFTVRLPCAAAPAMPRPAPAPAHTPSTRLRVLIADDNRDAAESLGLLLERMVAEVCVTNDGPAALAAFGDFQPHLVVLDIGMPGMDGYEVVKRLRALPQERRAVVAALTGWGQDDDRRRVREAGFDHHLVKPASLDDLRSLIASVAAACDDSSPAS
jgi:PAS domain S-box-containing protein